jgi:hypothetical protein
MEILSFALGMLSIIAVALVIVIVVGIVKVLKQQKEIQATREWLSNFERSVWQSFEDVKRDTDRRENNLYNTIAENGRDLHQQIENAYTNARDISNAYTDSRVDKLSEKLTGTMGAKTIIK